MLAKWLAREPVAPDRRRADARHRRRHQGRGAPAALGSRQPGRGDPDDLERAARGARHGRPRDRALRGPRVRRVRSQRGRPRSRSCARPRVSAARRRRERHRRRIGRRPARARAPAWPRRVVRFRELGIVLALLIVVARHRDRQQPLPEQHQPAAAALGRRDRGAARDRRDARDRDPQRRPLDRLDPRASRPTRRATSSCITRTSRCSSCCSPGRASGSPAASSTARSSRSAACPSLVVTLGTLYVIRGLDASWAGGNQVNSFSLPDSFNSARLRQAARRALPGHHHDRLRGRRDLRACARSARAATSTRSARTPRPRAWPASR